MFKKKLFTLLSATMMVVMLGASMLPALTAFAVTTNTRSDDLIFQKDASGNVIAILSKNGQVTPIGDVVVVRNASGVITGLETATGETVSVGGTVSLATTSASGVVQPDGVSITITASGVISATGSAASVALGDITGAGSGVLAAAASAVNSAGGLVAYDVSGQIPASSVADVLSISCTTPAENDTYIFNGTNLSCVHHPAPQSSASVSVTMDETFLNTITPNYSTGASNAVWTLPLAASMPGVAVGDEIPIAQSGVGSVTASEVSAAVTILAEGDKKTTNGVSAVMILKYLGNEFWRLVGSRTTAP